MFSESRQILHLKPAAVIQNHKAVKPAENLMGTVIYKEDLIPGDAVELRSHRKLTPSLIILQYPGTHIIGLMCDRNLIELMGSIIIEDYILRSLRRIAETAAQIEAKQVTVYISAAIAPEPFIMKRPDSSAPIEHAESL